MKVLSFIILFFTISLYAQGNLEIPVENFKLDNGLTVYLSKNNESPIVAVTLYYKVGSIYELEGKTGFAHFFEHMMFQGTRNVEKTEHFALIQKVGGNLNAFTTKEYTAYYNVVPANQLKLALWLEADRMENLSISFPNFKNQLEVVKEEMRMRYLNSPYGKLLTTIDENAHKSWNYQHSVIGSIADLDSSGVEYARNFFKTYYNPNNAVLTIVGDIDTKDAKKLVEEYFGKIKNQNSDYTLKLKEGKKGNKKVKIEDKLAKFPAIAIVYKAPSKATTKDYFSMKMLETVLFNNDSSRLYRALIKDKELAVSLYGGISDLKNDNLFYIFSMAKKGNSKKIKNLIFKEISNINKNGITEDELNKAKISFKTNFIFKLKSNLSKALMIGEYTLLHNSPDEIKNILSIIDSITVKDVKDIGNKYMKKEFLSEVDVTLAK
jgi:predicted Zn-dependent peptidase